MPHDSVRKDSLQETFDKSGTAQTEPFFGQAYERLLDKADRAFRFGLYKRAAKFYKEATLINPNSVYIQYRLKQIENRNSNFRNFLFYFDFEKPNLLIRSLTFLIVYFIVSMLMILLVWCYGAVAVVFGVMARFIGSFLGVFSFFCV